MSAQKRKVSTEEKVDRFWQMLEESPGQLKLVDPNSESPAVLWDIVCDKEMKLEGPLCTSIAEQVNIASEVATKRRPLRKAWRPTSRCRPSRPRAACTKPRCSAKGCQAPHV